MSQPAPHNVGIPISPLLISWLEKLNLYQTADLVRNRCEFGISKYGQMLMSGDGRDSVKDALEEIGDCLQYTFKALHNGEDITSLREPLKALCKLATGDDV